MKNKTESPEALSDKERLDLIDQEIAAACKKAGPHLLRAWELALASGHQGHFSEWLGLVLTDPLINQAVEIAKER